MGENNQPQIRGLNTFGRRRRSGSPTSPWIGDRVGQKSTATWPCRIAGMIVNRGWRKRPDPRRRLMGISHRALRTARHGPADRPHVWKCRHGFYKLAGIGRYRRDHRCIWTSARKTTSAHHRPGEPRPSLSARRLETPVANAIGVRSPHSPMTRTTCWPRSREEHIMQTFEFANPAIRPREAVGLLAPRWGRPSAGRGTTSSALMKAPIHIHTPKRVSTSRTSRSSRGIRRPTAACASARWSRME